MSHICNEIGCQICRRMFSNMSFEEKKSYLSQKYDLNHVISCDSCAYITKNKFVKNKLLLLIN